MRRMTGLVWAAVVSACTTTEGTAQHAVDSVRSMPTGASAPVAATFEGRLRVPRGFAVTEYARLQGPRFMVLGPDGAVYVSQPRTNSIVRLVDADGDGAAESVTTVAEGLNRPHGMAFRDGWLYVANTDGVVRLRFDSSRVVPGTMERLTTNGTGGHSTRTVVFGPDGGMYVSIGSSCNVCIEKTPERATVMRYDADGRNGRVYSSGLRNAVGVAVHPTTREIWVTTHERDNLEPDHENLPHEEIDILKDGGDFGWPYCHDDRVPNPEFNDAKRCAGTIPPALALQAHSAPLGISFLDRATKFPADWRGDALVAFHGSWNRDVPTGAKVVRVIVRDGKPQRYEDFIVGWQQPGGPRWGRPVDVLVNRDGAVLVSDDQSGIIYRVTAAAAK